MKNLILCCLSLSFLNGVFAQKVKELPPRVADFSISTDGDGQRFTPNLPALGQIAGAPEAYWTYVWEFGDGAMSTEKSPVHQYPQAGEFIATLDATAHYDDGKKATRKKAKVLNPKQNALAALESEDAFDPSAKQAIAMRVGAQPRPGEELSFVLSYRNKSQVPRNGRLHLFFNEKKFSAPHFKFLESRPCFGEVEAPLYSQIAPEMGEMEGSAWASVGVLAAAQVRNLALAGVFPPPTILLDARGKYRTEHAWAFENLGPGAERNFFLSLETLPTMIRDVNTLIHVQGIIVPDDPSVPAEPCVLEMKIVVAHDPNAIAVSDNRINYRSIRDQKVDYRVDFQNNGKGPASTVVVQIEMPEGLDLNRIKALDWQPKCPICPPNTPPTRSCLDTLRTKNGYQFSFRQIYLPGAAQEGVEKLDSTKGFVKYRIEADRNMPKYAFRSRAEIVFDREKPIYTNYTRTRFKVGISPGLKFGYSYLPDDSKSAYYFLGATLSPYKSWRVYPQIELLTGFKSRQNLPDEQRTGLQVKAIPGAIFKDTLLSDTLLQRQTGSFSFEIPLLLRKNFSKHIGLGLGISPGIIFENGQSRTKTQQTTIHWTDGANGFFKETIKGEVTEKVEPISATRYDFRLFGDLVFGSVRSGINLGLRGGALWSEGRPLRAFGQFSVELKL